MYAVPYIKKNRSDTVLHFRLIQI